jgi:hypothetical protein
MDFQRTAIKEALAGPDKPIKTVVDIVGYVQACRMKVHNTVSAFLDETPKDKWLEMIAIVKAELDDLELWAKSEIAGQNEPPKKRRPIEDDLRDMEDDLIDMGCIDEVKAAEQALNEARENYDNKEAVRAGEDYSGLCPVCRKNDGYLNIGRDHWFFCKEHKTKWCIGSNLFSAWREQTEDDQRKIFDDLNFGSFEIVEPVTHSRITDDGIPS